MSEDPVREPWIEFKYSDARIRDLDMVVDVRQIELTGDLLFADFVRGIAFWLCLSLGVDG